MKVLVIYSNDSKEKVDCLRKEIAERFNEETVLRLHSTNRKRGLIPHAWHKDAVRMMKLADVIVYVFSQQSTTNKNVNWELKKALKLNKHIVCLPAEPGMKPGNDCLYKTNPNTKGKECLAEELETKEDLFKFIEAFNSDSYIKLFHEPTDPAILLEQYKMFLETSENLVTRRQNVNSFYITANTALITVAGTIFAMDSQSALWPKLVVILALSIPGILLNFSWGRMLQSYYINNQGKIKILSMIEKRLAASLYDGEWKAMKNKFSRKKYVSFTDNEKILPWVFGILYVVVDIICGIVLALQNTGAAG